MISTPYSAYYPSALFDDASKSRETEKSSRDVCSRVVLFQYCEVYRFHFLNYFYFDKSSSNGEKKKKDLPWTELCSPPWPKSSSTSPTYPKRRRCLVRPTWQTEGCSQCTRGRRRRESRPGALPLRLGGR